jgi:hypothetical protein
MGRYINVGATIQQTGAKKIFFPAAGTSATQTWTVPAGVTCLTFELWGGGGAGAPSCCCTCYGGAPGGGGGYSMKTLTVTPGNTYSIVVGQGGCGNMCWFNGNACGCQGLVTYITGAGLTNFCALGGKGGHWCNDFANGSCGGCAYGGDVNITGADGNRLSQNFYAANSAYGLQVAGASPFGGGSTIVPAGVGSVSGWLNCGTAGTYPGGGSPARTMFAAGWCDCCSGCTSGGADGLVIITI